MSPLTVPPLVPAAGIAPEPAGDTTAGGDATLSFAASLEAALHAGAPAPPTLGTAPAPTAEGVSIPADEALLDAPPADTPAVPAEPTESTGGRGLIEVGVIAAGGAAAPEGEAAPGAPRQTTATSSGSPPGAATPSRSAGRGAPGAGAPPGVASRGVAVVSGSEVVGVRPKSVEAGGTVEARAPTGAIDESRVADSGGGGPAVTAASGAAASGATGTRADDSPAGGRGIDQVRRGGSMRATAAPAPASGSDSPREAPTEERAEERSAGARPVEPPVPASMVLASSLARALGMDARTGEREVAEDGSGDGSTREPSAPADAGPGRAAGPARRLDDGGPLARKIAAAVGRIFAELLGGQQATGAGETDGPVAHGPIQGDVDACNGAPPRLPVGPRVVAAVDGEVVNRSLGAAGRPGTPAGQPRHPGAAAPLRGASASPEVPGGPGELAAGRPDRNSEPTAGNSVSGDVAPPVAPGDGIASTGDMPLAREGTEPGRPVRGAAPASGSPTVGDRGPGDRVTLHLTDDAGGVTRVRIAVRGERLRATIVPPDGEAARRLRVATGELERSLAQHGFPDARVTVQASMPAAPPSEAGPHWFSAPPPSGPSEVAVARGQDAPTSDPHRGSDGHPSDRRGQRQDRPHDRPHDRPAEGRERQGS